MTKSREELDRLAAYQRQWNARNKRRVKEYNLMARYGWTIDQFEQAIADQNDACAVCLKQFDHTPAKRDIVIDHNHDTGKVRGIVCAKCNAILGRVNKDIEVLRRAVAYLERN